MKSINFFTGALLGLSFISTLAAAATEKNEPFHLMTAEAVQWGYLNPLRGDKSPGAADLWGDRTKNVATGMLVKFNKGFASPPHIHNISYRGVVIKGKMHNDDPNAAQMWMPTGSFWTQPAGENHITAAEGEDNLIYLEIDSGPYLVQPSTEQFDNGERPINLHESNLVWLGQNELTFINSRQVEMASLWGQLDKAKLGGALIKLSAGFNGQILTNASEFRVVVISGELSYQSKGINKPTALRPGSYLDSAGEFKHNLSATSEAVVYIRTNKLFTIIDK